MQAQIGWVKSACAMSVHSKTAAILVVSGRSTRAARRSLAYKSGKNISSAHKHGLHTSLVCIKA